MPDTLNHPDQLTRVQNQPDPDPDRDPNTGTDTTPARICPECGKEYFTRVRARRDREFSVGRLYRHHAPDGWVYLHWIYNDAR